MLLPEVHSSSRVRRDQSFGYSEADGFDPHCLVGLGAVRRHRTGPVEHQCRREVAPGKQNIANSGRMPPQVTLRPRLGEFDYLTPAQVVDIIWTQIRCLDCGEIESVFSCLQ